MYEDLNALKNRNESNLKSIASVILENISDQAEIDYFNLKESEINSLKISIKSDSEHLNSTINKLEKFSSMKNNMEFSSKNLKYYFKDG